MKIFYWSPFISKVATVSSVIKSADSIVKYSKKENNINVAIIDAIGEWKNYRKIIKFFHFSFFNISTIVLARSRIYSLESLLLIIALSDCKAFSKSFFFK